MFIFPPGVEALDRSVVSPFARRQVSLVDWLLDAQQLAEMEAQVVSKIFFVTVRGQA